MSDPFLKLVANYTFENYKDNLEKLCIVLPTKRGSLFLKTHLSKIFGKNIWLPTIISIEEFISELSELKTLEEIDLICYLYESYKIIYGANAENFESFAKWGQLILQDFNEIDRSLANSEQLYENLKDIKEIENWSLGHEVLTEYQINYLKFMNSLGPIYKHFSDFLLTNKWAYQGLSYKNAVLNYKTNNYVDQFFKIIFCGFNALNTAELKIFNWLFEEKKADILWDADNYYLANLDQEAGFFLRKNFKVFNQHQPLFIQDNFKNDKEINIISVPKQIGQAQVVKQILQQYIDLEIPLDKVAVILANEKLLWPVLQQLPSSVEHVNITMEYPLKYTSTYVLIDILMQLQINFAQQSKKDKTIYHKDFIGLLRQPIFKSYLKAKGINVSINQIINHITTQNLTTISPSILNQLFSENYDLIKFLLQPLTSILDFCKLIQDVLETTIKHFSIQQNNNHVNLELEYLQIILKNFNRLDDILNKYSYFNEIKAFKQLVNQIVGNATAPFIGEPLRGLQIMGVLETRTLDFDYVILVSANEGVLPSGKTMNSFIPNDLKRAFGLPLYQEKDAIYAYHFYRLLQKAKEATLIYNSETDTLGKGEKSRFISQLQLELLAYNPNTRIIEKIANYPSFAVALKNEITITKNIEVLEPIINNAIDKGISPSSILLFKECSLRFYFSKSVHLKELAEVQENAQASTFGNILHKSLETLYKQFIGKVIQADNLKVLLNKIDQTVNDCFSSFFGGNKPIGKGILQQEVIKVYVKKLINYDINFIDAIQLENQILTLKDLEQTYSTSLQINLFEKLTTIIIKGKIDRIDSFNNEIRIIDFKTSIKDSDEFIFENFELLFSDKNYNKQLQLLIYAWILFKNNYCEAEKIKVCIIPFKFFLTEPKYVLDTTKEKLLLTNQFFLDFENELKKYIETIFDLKIPFIQTDDHKSCEYCAYNAICNIEA